MTKQPITRADKVKRVTYDMRGPIAEAAAKLEAEGQKILKLNIGNVSPFGIMPPPNMVGFMVKNLPAAAAYSEARGLKSAREAIAAWHVKHGVNGVTANDVYLGNGDSELIDIALKSLINPGDEVLVPAPDYPVWNGCTIMAGGNPIHYLCDEANEWQPSLADIEAKINERTKAIVIINPNNPTGALYGKEVLLQILELCRKHNLVVFSDEIYSEVVYDEAKHISTGSLADDLPIVTFNGISKSWRACGYRGGWMTFSGDKEVIKDWIAAVTLLTGMRLCSNVMAQFAMQSAVTDEANSPAALIAPGGEFCLRRDAAYAAFNAIDGINVVKAKAAFYMFPKVDIARFGIKSDKDFVYSLLLAKKVLITHGTSFAYPIHDHFRLVFLPDVETIKGVASAMNEFLRELESGKAKLLSVPN
ncbi:MAG: aminotransferase class I/II-fold pyridoxal phosphate-dependent enzyme [Spirochaetaceae bacterium]|nr:aminotransferase class I/II-fold pyridoxal phosphate-dependent enzyme [Spirochaetaceae bacterium]